MTQPKRGRGRPLKEGGPTPVRHIRLGDIWDEAHAAARANNETFAHFVERAIRAEVKRLQRKKRAD